MPGILIGGVSCYFIHYLSSRFQILPDRTLVLRAQVPIKAGEEITIQYMTPMLGNVTRTKKIKYTIINLLMFYLHNIPTGKIGSLTALAHVVATLQS